jgi:hypothetical protein
LFNLVILFEAVRPLEGGTFRLKFRRDRRFGMKQESRFVFYPRYPAAMMVKAWWYLRVYRDAMRDLKRVLCAPDRWTYTDLAIAAPREDELCLDHCIAQRGNGRGRVALHAAQRFGITGSVTPRAMLAAWDQLF